MDESADGFAYLTRDHVGFLVDRYSERREVT